MVEHNLAKVGVASSSLVFRSNTKSGSSSDDLKFWKRASAHENSPDGVQHMSVVLVHKAGFFLYIPPDHTDFSLKVGILRRTVHKSVESSLKAANLRTSQFSPRDLLPTTAEN